jgi:hypothetical protein
MMTHSTTGALGVYQATSNGCAEGGDFRCGPKGGILSCRPCDFPQLGVFEDLQTQINRLLTALNIDLPPTMKDGNQQSLLWVDGRIGPKTTTAVGLIGIALDSRIAPPIDVVTALAAAAQAPTVVESMALVAQYAQEIGAYFRQAADQLAAAQVPSGRPTDEELLKTPEKEEIAAKKAEAEKKSTWVWWVVGAAAVAGAAGLGYYLYKRSQRGALGGYDDDDDDDDADDRKEQFAGTLRSWGTLTEI